MGPPSERRNRIQCETRGESGAIFMLNPVIFAGYGLKSRYDIEQF